MAERKYRVSDIDALWRGLDIALGALADIATSEDMTLEIARKKAKRVYTTLQSLTKDGLT